MMTGKWMRRVVGLSLALTLAVVWNLTAQAPSQQQQRETFTKNHKDGNYKDAYEGFRKLALNPADDPHQVGSDLDLAVDCLRRLGRIDEADEFREAVIKIHEKNWRLLQTAALSYGSNNYNEHYGYIVAGKFYRGFKRGGRVRYVHVMPRDRGRALQLMTAALEQAKGEPNKGEVAKFYLTFANFLLNGAGRHEPWRLQYLTDVSKLPDYEEGYYSNAGAGAPVDDEGNPIYHRVPKSYETAESDGQRWRWLLTNAAELDPSRLNETDMIFADFLNSQFGVGTMAYFGHSFRGDDGPKTDKKTGTFALHTLGEDETIARLATGVKRFNLPDEFNYIKIYQRVANRAKSDFGARALGDLAQIFEDRRQYPKAASVWQRAIADYGPGNNNYRQDRLNQIVGNWARFELGQMQPNGVQPIVDLRFRNGNKVSFEAHEIKVAKLLDDVKAYLKSSPNQLDWSAIQINNIGQRLVFDNQTQYLGEKAAAWDLDLKPRKDHVDDRVTVTTPLKKPGAYLLSATMAGGNTTRVIVWIADTVILKKNLEGQVYYFVADAATGQPVPEANLDFFGYKQVQVQPNTNQFQVLTQNFAQTTDKDGQLILGPNQQTVGMSWLITARQKKGDADRFAYLGFTGVWFNQKYDPEYNQKKVFTITDRPVYRPEQTVNFKFWVGHAKYDQVGPSEFAGQSFEVKVQNPKGDKVLEKTIAADEYGGLSGEYMVPSGAMLGTYQVYIHKLGGGSFRVEEYKKPEFEVSVEAPKEPVALGEMITATIQAKYYFGAPVTHAKVKYKVLRTNHTSNWYPRANWDWMYGNGYWWFSGDYAWYPGWREWGMRRPTPTWWRQGGWQPPEVVLENEVPIGADGMVKVAIDTMPAKELHGDRDHKYSITAEVVDESRRTIVGTGDVLVSRKPFKVYSWVDKGYYHAGDTIKAFFFAQTIDSKPVEGKGELTLFQISYDDKNEPVEKAVQTWKLDTNVEGRVSQQMKAAKAGQYRLSFSLTDSKSHTIEGGYLFVVRGTGFNGKDYRFNDIEILADRQEYNPGDKVKLAINVNKNNGTVLLFVRPTNGVYQAPKVLRLQGKSIEEEIDVIQRDMPNFFVEALTIADGRVHTEVREVVVPPEKRVLNIEVLPSQTEYKPGQKATVKIKLTDFAGKAFLGSTVVSMYDKSVEYISGGAHIPEIKEFFWKWRRHHSPYVETSLNHSFGALYRRNETSMNILGRFGDTVVEEMEFAGRGRRQAGLQNGLDDRLAERDGYRAEAKAANFAAAAPGMGLAGGEQQLRALQANDAQAKGGGGEPPLVQPTVRRNFADTALWIASLTTDKNGEADVTVTMPDNLTAWKIRVWGMAAGTRVGQGEATVTTKKDLIVRLQAPRFFVEKDEVVLSANVHNYLKKEKKVHVTLETEGGTLSSIDKLTQIVTIAAGDEKRIDWRVKVVNEGDAIVRMKALSDEDSDAMEMRFPCYVHGMLKMESFTGVIRADQTEGAKVALTVPAERRINQTMLEVRYSPTLAGAMVDALPYLVDYPYGCTEQTLNRFIPTVITQKLLLSMKLDLKEIQKHRTNLNSQEIGDDKERIAKGWKRFPRNPVFDEAEVHNMAAAGVRALSNMQLSDGGWGWFSGWGERSSPHTTATVVHGLQLAKQNNIELPPGMLERGAEWLRAYQNQQVQMLQNAPSKTIPYKEHADNMDAMVYMVLLDSDINNEAMREFLYRDRTFLSVYAKAMYGLTLHKQQLQEKLDMILKNIEQYVVQDDENQTAYLRMPEGNTWWHWYGSDIEANAYYLKLLSRTNAKDIRASRLVKYILNNRRHATYWNSTRDTSLCIEAMAEYLKASGEDRPDMTIEVWLDGKKQKEVHVDTKNLFYFDNRMVLVGDAVENGKHILEIKRKGTGPVYFNAYLTNFTLEDFITKAGLEIRVNRKYYKLTKVDAKVKVPSSKNRPLDQKIEKYERTEIANLATLKSGDLVEIELEIDSKNDYEYLCFEDPKTAGFEPVEIRSGYTRDGTGAYMEMRDDRVCFFARTLARGKHSYSYRMRAEIPGQFSALPTRAFAMYAPELKGNSDEIKVRITD